MEALTPILDMVKEILAYFQEADAAAVIEIVKNALATILGDINLPL